MIKKFYVWSGSLRGVAVDAHSPSEAVNRAVRDNLPCVLNQVIRVSLRKKGHHDLDVYYWPPYEDLFPDLFNGDLDIEVAKVSTDE